MATAGAWHEDPLFRKLLYHEQITGARRPHACPPAIQKGSIASANTSEDRPSTQYPTIEGVGTCGSLTGPHAPHAREATLTSFSSREQRRTAPSSSAGAARSGPSALRTRSTTGLSSVCGAG